MNISKTTISSNGEVTFSNPTTAGTSLSLWGGGNGQGKCYNFASFVDNSLNLIGKVNDIVDTSGKTMVFNGITASAVSKGASITKATGILGNSLIVAESYIAYRKDRNKIGYNTKKYLQKLQVVGVALLRA